MENIEEKDPNGKSQHEKGSKLDSGKTRLGLVFSGFSRALEEVGKVGTFGAEKYTPDGWISVPNGKERYTDAMFRHYVKEAQGLKHDPDSKLLHSAHLAWNALARLELELREMELTDDKVEDTDYCPVCDHHHCICNEIPKKKENESTNDNS